MGRPIIINEAVWSFGCLRIIFPDQENREKFLQAEFKFFKGGVLVASGRTADFLPKHKNVLLPGIYDDNGEHYLFLDIVLHDPQKNGGTVAKKTKFFDPFSWDGTHHLEVHALDKKMEVRVTRITRRTREHHGLPEDH